MKSKIRDFDLQVDKEIESKNKEFLSKKELLLNMLDKDDDGEIDLIDNDLDKLLHKNQELISEIDKNYIHQFIKISQYLKTKKLNLQNIFISAKGSSDSNELEEVLNLLRNQVHTYESLIFHSINMISSLNNHDLITFYEIYESFDKLGIFNSNWENEVSDKLSVIGYKLDDLLYSLYQMELSIVSGINNLSYVTQDSFNQLNESVTKQLKEVKSTINAGNLLNSIQTYQLYKINKSFKSLNN